MNWTSLRQYWSNNTCVTAPNVSSFSSPEKPCALFSKIRNCNLKSQIPFLEKIHSALPAATSSARQRSGGRSVIPWFTVPFALTAALAVVFGLLFLNQRRVLDRSGGNTLVEEVISAMFAPCSPPTFSMFLRPISTRSNPGSRESSNSLPRFKTSRPNSFLLMGGRLDYINGRKVAALVYHRNKHIVNLFIAPSDSGRTEALQSFSKDGYNVLDWNRDGFEFWAGSDMSAGDLRAFADLEMSQA